MNLLDWNTNELEMKVCIIFSKIIFRNVKVQKNAPSFQRRFQPIVCLHALDMKKGLAVHFRTVFIQFAVTKLVARVSLVILWKPY